MCKEKMLTVVAVLVVCFAFIAEISMAAQPKTASAKYMFNIRANSNLAPTQRDVAEKIEILLKKSIGGNNCFAESKLLTYVSVVQKNILISPQQIVGVAVASLEANCKESADLVTKFWAFDISLEVFSDIPVGPWPIVSGGN